MSYPAAIVREMQAVSPACFVCNHKFLPGEYKAIHSGSGYHFVLKEVGNPVRYVYEATDPPECYAYTRGTYFEVNTFPIFGFRYYADAVCVCNSCHKAIHALALELCRTYIPKFKGNTPVPMMLVEATFNFNLYDIKLPAN